MTDDEIRDGIQEQEDKIARFRGEIDICRVRIRTIQSLCRHENRRTVSYMGKETAQRCVVCGDE